MKYISFSVSVLLWANLGFHFLGTEHLFWLHCRLVKHKSSLFWVPSLPCWAQVNKPEREAHVSWVTPKGYEGKGRLRLVSAPCYCLSHPWRQCGLKKALSFPIWMPSAGLHCLVWAVNLSAVNTYTHTLGFDPPAAAEEQPLKEEHFLTSIAGDWLLPWSRHFTAPPGHWGSVLWLCFVPVPTVTTLHTPVLRAVAKSVSCMHLN